MLHPTKTALSLAALSIFTALALSSCGGGAANVPPADKPGDVATKPDPVDDNAATLPPVTGGTIPRPADATASGEFVITGVRAKALAQSLGFDTSAGSARSVNARGLRAQATTDEMRVLLSVTRSKTDGPNLGKQRGMAKFVWGNQIEKVVTLGKSQDSNGGVFLNMQAANGTAEGGTAVTNSSYEGTLNMTTTYPNFQTSSSKSTPYVDEKGGLCVRLSYSFTTAQVTPGVNYQPLVFNNLVAPLVVCEGTTEREAEKVALEKASTGMLYQYQSEAAAAFTFSSKDGATALPTDAAGYASVLNTQAGDTVAVSTLDDFFAPLTVLPGGDPALWSADDKVRAATARKYIALQKQFGYYYTSMKVYTVSHSGTNKKDIYILGLNGWGIGGLHTIQFYVPPVMI